MLHLVPFDKLYLAKSYNWLNEPEIQALTDGPIGVTCEEQERWFALIQNDTTYQIWGIEYQGVPIGACGIKHINYEQKIGEYWGYIGEKKYWGNKGKLIFENIYIKARELNIETLTLSVLKSNIRAIRLYEKEGFKCYIEKDKHLLMIKCNII